MNVKVAVLFFAVAVTWLEVISANAISQDLVAEDLNNSLSDPKGLFIHHRQKRFTCDVLSFSAGGISLRNSACAVRCVAMRRGFRGGYCNKKAICVCRK